MGIPNARPGSGKGTCQDEELKFVSIIIKGGLLGPPFMCAKRL